MSFHFCDSMIHQYRTEGFAVFRQILPPSLISDLRKATVRVPEIARNLRGPQAQRLQPVASHDIDLKPFKDYAELPPLVDAIARLLTPRHKIRNEFDRTGILIEPAERPGWTNWHRDITEESNVPDLEEFRRITRDPHWFNQINCPLYEDNCTWYVPGSYLRENFTEEVAAAIAQRPPEGASYGELERTGIVYAQGMPRAVRLSMDAGDFAIYHPNAWHLGNYLPDRKRVTIHDFAPTPELLDWYRRWSEKRASN